MAIIRLILGKLILLFNWLFTPRGIKRDPGLQASIDAQTADLALYHYQACPFCVKVGRLNPASEFLKSNTVRDRYDVRPEVIQYPMVP